MICSDFARCRSFQFCFDSGEALYIDHNGHRVLADVEGEGSYVIVRIPSNSDLSVDGISSPHCSNQFCESLVVSSPNSGLSQIGVVKGKIPANLAVAFEGNEFQGCGWILKADRLDRVDGIEDGWNRGGPFIPVPVFREALGSRLSIAKLPFRTETLASLDLAEDDSLKLFNWRVKNASQLFVLESTLPGFGDLRAKVLSHLNLASLLLPKPQGCEGVIIRRLYDAFHGRQRARVLVDGEFQGWWFEPVEDRTNRWRWGHFGFGCTPNLEKLSIEIDPAAGTPLWSVSRYEVIGLFPNG